MTQAKTNAPRQNNRPKRPQSARRSLTHQEHQDAMTAGYEDCWLLELVAQTSCPKSCEFVFGVVLLGVATGD